MALISDRARVKRLARNIDAAARDTPAG